MPLITWALVAAGAAVVADQLSGSLAELRTPALAAIGAAFLLQMMRRAEPAWLLSAGIAASMFSGHWADLGLRSAAPPDRVLLLAGVAAVVFRIGPSRDRPTIQPRPVHFALAAALAYAAISMVLVGTYSNRIGLFALLDQFGAIPFLLFAVSPIAFRTAYQRAVLLGSLVATGAYLSITAVCEKLGLGALTFPTYIDNPAVGLHYGRSRGPFAEAVANGLALYACAVAGTIAFVVWRRAWPRAFALAVTALSTVGVLLTVTRAVWLGAVVATVLVFAAAPRLRRFLVPTVAAGAILAAGALAFIPGLSQQASDRQNDQSPIWERKNSDAAAARMIAARPVLGFGWYQHNEPSEPYFRQAPDYPLSGERAGLHNLFLTYAVDLGLAGFAIWLLGAALAIGGAVRGRAPPSIGPWQLGLAALVACYIVAGVAGPVAYVYPTLLLWTWAGVASLRERDVAGSDAGAWRYDLERVPGKVF